MSDNPPETAGHTSKALQSSKRSQALLITISLRPPEALPQTACPWLHTRVSGEVDHADARVVIADLQAFGVAIAGVQRIVHVVNLEVVLHLSSRKARDESRHIKTYQNRQSKLQRCDAMADLQRSGSGSPRAEWTDGFEDAYSSRPHLCP